MFSIKSKKLAVVGVDISTASIKLLELSKTRDSYRVESYAMEPIPAEAIVDKVIKDVDAVGQVLRRAVKKSGTRTKHAVLAVAGSAVIIKKITMSAELNDEEMESQLQLEADQYIPYPLEEVYMDFTVLGPLKGNDNLVEVMLVASRSENIRTLMRIAEIAGLTAKIIDIETFAIENAYPLVRDLIPDYGVDKVTAIIDIGSQITNFYAIEDDRIIYSREQDFGGEKLTNEIMLRYGLSQEDATKVKKHGGLPDNYAEDVLEPFKQEIIQQVERFIQLFCSATDYDNVDFILLAGGSASIPGIASLIEEHIRIPTIMADPLAGLELSGRVSKQNITSDAPSLLMVAGLALRGAI